MNGEATPLRRARERTAGDYREGLGHGITMGRMMRLLSVPNLIVVGTGIIVPVAEMLAGHAKDALSTFGVWALLFCASCMQFVRFRKPPR
jgi:hypothetical protein